MARRKPSENGGAAEYAPPAPQPQDVPPDAPPAEEDHSNLPVHTVRFGLVRACVWETATEQGPRHNVTVSRLYKGTDGLWYSSTVFWYRDLLPLAKALDCVHTWIAERIAAAAESPF